MDGVFPLLQDQRLAPHAASSAPAWLWSLDGTRLLWANAVGAAILGAVSPAAAMQRRLARTDPIATQIARLAATLSHDGSPRLERLRGLASGIGRLSTCACRRLQLADEGAAVLVLGTERSQPNLPFRERVRRLLAGSPVPCAAFAPDGTLLHASSELEHLREANALAALGVQTLAAEALRSGLAIGSVRGAIVSIERIGADDETALVAMLSCAAAAQPAAEPFGQDGAPATTLAAPSPAGMTGSPLPAEPAEGKLVRPEAGQDQSRTPASPPTQRLASATDTLPAAAVPLLEHNPMRFIWQTDADNRFTLTSDQFLRATGARTAAMLGRTWNDVASELGVDPEQRVAHALAGRETWSGVHVGWPVDGSDTRLDVEMSGLPVFDREGKFLGYRGFGVAPEPAQDGRADSRPLPEHLVPMPPPQGPDARQSVAAPEPPEASPELQGSGALPSADGMEARAALPPGCPALNAVEQTAFSELARQLTERLRHPPAVDEAGQELAASEPAANAGPATVSLDHEAADDASVAPERADTSGAADGGADASAAPSVSDADQGIADRAPDPGFPGAASVIADAPAARSDIPAELRDAAAVPDLLPYGILIYRLDRLLFANRAFLQWVGEDSLDALAAAGGLDALRLESARVEAQAPARSFTLASPNGEQPAVEGRLSSIDWHGETALMLVTQPADERHRATEMALRRREAEIRELQSILDTATDGVMLIDGGGQVVAVNASAEALFGYDAPDIIGRPFADMFAPESRRAALDYLDGLRRTGVAGLLHDGRELIGRVRQGGLVPLFMTIGRIGEGSGKFCAVLRDITQWKRAEEELLNSKRLAEKASSAKSDFLARISHEIRTPLNAIIGFSEVMMDERFGPIGNERYRQYLKDIHTSGDHVVLLLNDLLDLSKIEAGKLELSFTTLNLNELTQQCVALMQQQANRERIIIRSSLSPKLAPIVADARSVRQILLNLLSHSIKSTSAGGQAIVSTAVTDAGDVVLRVRDNGIGMSEKELEAALEPFRQLPTTGHPGMIGGGLGLPLTKALAEANRATFHIRSGINAGTLVEITFQPARALAEKR